MNAKEAIHILNDGSWWNYLPDCLPEDVRDELCEAIDFAELQIRRMENTTKRIVASKHKAGVCPICGGSLIYAINCDELSGTPDAPTVESRWTCAQCKAAGTERRPAELEVSDGFQVVNVGDGLIHCNVKEVDGTEIELKRI